MNTWRDIQSSPRTSLALFAVAALSTSYTEWRATSHKFWAQDYLQAWCYLMWSELSIVYGMLAYFIRCSNTTSSLPWSRWLPPSYPAVPFTSEGVMLLLPLNKSPLVCHKVLYYLPLCITSSQATHQIHNRHILLYLITISSTNSFRTQKDLVELYVVLQEVEDFSQLWENSTYLFHQKTFPLSSQASIQIWSAHYQLVRWSKISWPAIRQEINLQEACGEHDKQN